MEHFHKEVLAQTFREIMESLAFLFAEDMPKNDLPPFEGENLCASLSYSGPTRGMLHLICPMDLCRELAANMLGVEKDDPESQAKASDALKEALNTICGRYLSAVFGDKAVFTLSIPQIRILLLEEWQLLAKGGNSLLFQVDDRIVLMAAEEPDP